MIIPPPPNTNPKVLSKNILICSQTDSTTNTFKTVPYFVKPCDQELQF